MTGGGRGIGRAIAAALTKDGHDVTILGRTRLVLEEAVAAGAAASAHVLDVTDLAALESFAGSGRFDILVNNAGGTSTAPFLKTGAATLREAFVLNVESAAAAMRGALPFMTGSGFGRVVNIASTAGVRGYAYVSTYVAAKHALVGLTRAVAIEVAPKGVTVNAVCPGYTDTALLAGGVEAIQAATGRSAAEARAHFAAASPLGRLVRPDEVAALAAYLAGPAAAAITGQAIPISGGDP